MSRNNELDRVWRLYQRNIQLHRPSRILPPCPVCLRPITLPGDPLPVGAVAASRGHLWPDPMRLDGPGVVLECRDCNSRFGKWFDHALATQVKHDRMRLGRLPRDEQLRLLNRRGSWVTVNGHPATAQAKPEGVGFSLTLNVGKPYPDLKGGPLDLRLRDPAPSRVIAGVLHSAYLQLFWHLGYEYVFEASVQGIRQDLHRAVAAAREPSDHALERWFGRYGVCVLRQPRPTGWQDLGLIRHPKPLSAFVVFVPAVEGASYVVVMPGFGAGAARLYDRFAKADGAQTVAQQVVWDAPRELRLAHPDAARWGRRLWAGTIGDMPPEAAGGHIAIAPEPPAC